MGIPHYGALADSGRAQDAQATTQVNAAVAQVQIRK
jgi:hypothetical protein